MNLYFDHYTIIMPVVPIDVAFPTMVAVSLLEVSTGMLGKSLH